MDLRELWKAAVRSQHEAKAAAHHFDAAVARAKAERLVPPGYSIDVLGDGKVKPDDECAKVLKE